MFPPLEKGGEGGFESGFEGGFSDENQRVAGTTVALILQNYSPGKESISLHNTSMSIERPYRGQEYLMFDKVTHTLDREAFEYLLNLEVKKAARYLYFFSLMVLQRDKTSKDFSPTEEEILIRKLAAIVKEEVRTTDIIGRIGNDKFFLILDQADFQSSFKVGGRIKDRIEHYVFKTDGHIVGMTTSIGIACFPTHASDIVTLRHKADLALNMAIEGGGGKVCLPAD